MNSSSDLLKQIKKSVGFLVENAVIEVHTAIILGSGLGNFIHEVEIIKTIPYDDIPGFMPSTIEGHSGNLVFAAYKSIPMVIMQGRHHFYEGYSMNEITYPIRVLKYLGIEKLIITNASGGMNPDFAIGDIMILTDHINLMPNPLIGEHIEEFGARSPDMSVVYDPEIINLAKQIAQKRKTELKEGCYVAVTGPTYETPAEYKYFRLIGGDAVGMSTVPEVIVARQMGIRCFALSVITDLGIPGKIEYLTHGDVQKAASEVEPVLSAIIKDLITAI